MSFLPSLTTVVAQEEHLRPLPMSEWAFGGISIGIFLALLALLWSFRNTASRHGQATGGSAGHGNPGRPGDAVQHRPQH